MADVTKTLMLDSTGQQIINAIQNVSIMPQIVDNCTTADSTKALSANQGKVLNDKITSLLATKLTIIEYSHLDFTWHGGDYLFYKTVTFDSNKKIIGFNGWFTNGNAMLCANYREQENILNVMGLIPREHSTITSAYQFKLFVYLIDA